VAITGGLSAHCARISHVRPYYSKSYLHLTGGPVIPGFQDGCKVTTEENGSEQRT
jgi:hypothetical protein